MARRLAMVWPLALALALAGAGCGGGGTNSGSDKNGSPSRPASRTSVTRTASASVSPAAATSSAATSLAGETPGAATAASGTTPATDDGGQPGQATPAPNDATPVPTSVALGPASDIPSTSVGGPSSFESTIAASLGTDAGGNDIAGGDPNSAPHVVATVPPVSLPPGTTPSIDPETIASPDVQASDVEVIVDANATASRIQATRDVHLGDVFRVGVVISNVEGGASGGIGAFNFTLHYDKTKIVAPSIAGGSATDRNPDLNTAALDGATVDWACLPAPEGDLDDPGGISGDGDPAIGEALLSCFTPGTGHASGTIVLAVVTFHAIASGSTELRLSDVSAGAPLGRTYSCDVVDTEVPCTTATINVS